MRKLIMAAACAALACACSNHPAPEYTPVPVVDLYSAIGNFTAMSPTARDSVMSADTAALDAFWKVVGGGSALGTNSIEVWSESPVARIFTPATDSVYPNTTLLSDALGRITAEAPHQDIDLPRRSYAAVVWGRKESMLFVDSVMLIALNHYLGEDYPGYSSWPEYQRRLKSPEYLPGDIAEALACTAMPYSAPDHETLLSKMLYQGASVLARKRLAGEKSDETALGYTPGELEWLRTHEKELWDALVTRRMLYDTSTATALRLLSPSPSTGTLVSGAPGRAGRYVGYRIVESYVHHHPKAGLGFLLSPRFYGSPEDVLRESGYNPGK